MDASAPESVSARSGEYALGERLAGRGHDEGYRATEVSTGRSAEVVLFEPGNREFWGMYQDEVLDPIKRIRHENVAQLIDNGFHQDRFFVVWELVEGATVGEIVSRARRRAELLPPELGAYVGARAARGLEAGHSLEGPAGTVGVLHRDMVPSNIAVTRAGIVKVLDWGITPRTPPRSGLMGPRAYAIAPERLEGGPPSAIDGRADAFELGAVIFELLAGKRLFAAESDMGTLELIQRGVRPDFDTSLAHVSEGLRDVVARAVAHRREDRFGSAGELAASLEAHAEGFGPEQAAEATQRP